MLRVCLFAVVTVVDSRRVVAVGDVHGDVAAFTRVLTAAQIIDPSTRRWAGGTTTLVQLGDILDRGRQEGECWSLPRSLRQEAGEAGGEVITLLGNHEILNVCGQAANYVHPKAQLAFGPDRTMAFAPGGELALELSEWPVCVILDRTAYVHGGLPNGATVEGIEALNRETRRWLPE